MGFRIQNQLFVERSHSPELDLFWDLLQQYDWDAIDREVGARYKEAAAEFHRTKRGGSKCPKNAGEEEEEDNLESLERTEAEATLFDVGEVVESASPPPNPRGAGRRGERFLSYVKAFLLAPVLHVKQNCAHISLALRTNPLFVAACDFRSLPAQRTLQDFDQIMNVYDLWDLVNQRAYQKNVEAGIINETTETAVLVDNTHLMGFSTPKKSIKECRECPHFQECSEKVSTDKTADWYVKSKCKVYYAHMVGGIQLADSGAPLDCVVLNGKQWEPDTLKPLCLGIKEKYPNLNILRVIVDGIFDNERCRQVVKKYLGAELVANVNPGNRKDIPEPATGIEKITKYGTTICIAGHEMVFMGKDENLQAHVMACPVFNPEARAKLEHLGIDTSELSCECKEQCSPNSTKGRAYRLPKALVPMLYDKMPQTSFTHKFIFRLRTKIERLFGYAKERLEMKGLYKRGVEAVLGHVKKYLALIHLIANVQGRYAF